MDAIGPLIEDAPGRLKGRGPIGIIDIGSNSVRLVIYERLSRSPTPLYNEKVLAGLGKGLAKTGRLADDSVRDALSSIRRFRQIAQQSGCVEVHALATAAARDASNGPEFLAEVERLSGASVRLLSGADEARLSALGVMSGVHHPNGIVGDMGGGSLELVDLHGHSIGHGRTFPLGGLRLAEAADGSVKKAEKICEDLLKGSDILRRCQGRDFYAVGGTWRSLAKLHMFQHDYPLHVMHQYSMATGELLDFCDRVARGAIESSDRIEVISKSRRALLPFGAVLLGQLIRIGKPNHVVLSALGVREGHLFELLTPAERRLDPLLVASEELSHLRSRSPQHARELGPWTGRLFEAIDLDETQDEARLRIAACNLADIGWRAHPDYRGEQSLNIIAHAAFVGVDHPGRAYLALANYYRHVGLVDDAIGPGLERLITPRLRDRAKAMGAAFRVAYVLSTAMAGIIPRVRVSRRRRTIVLGLPADLASLDGERLQRRLKQFAKLGGMDGAVEIG